MEGGRGLRENGRGNPTHQWNSRVFFACLSYSINLIWGGVKSQFVASHVCVWLSQ